ncbi:pro-sigmaK processing inhibitor BofA family protein [Anaerocellum danielii]|uniref:Pro-sigmaK processing inhibitor BofA family protein n=1 Tax=Anaerocellum danielii TaxID=1387557 RepID=A0ABZ0U451_9FIRM|nr:pro-sigmaK processing inhibitor BofA family protein [Caldicellulosiruptor danielii]WPX09842.1 pro-sigmaK processing inhibitor BofA family protein [Caldicellulosiruptor danielii]
MKLFELIIRFIFTASFIILFNLLCQPYNLHIGFNIINLAIGTLIGFSGFALLLILALLFR